ncbi:Inositol 2-dehydrogenase [Maioricimonas rarisocia]|uniref:Inositol 2-dehydrogenase n=1 Tax=Maioricimonas rarisocia TaxID=2528026 RepID=A0A517Z8W9_9PLAN|nr:Gfo/Idh/MocA family oxidoreductase [Maioricimonas rarisocia]QDU38913.1 Inositol 2-dehydrogenase [Maioricimonas rarisocia]
MSDSSRITRRDVLKRTSAAAAGFAAAPWIIPSTAFGANERITVGCIGLRNQGKGNLQRFLKAGCNVAAVCDVDSDVRAKAAKIVTDRNRSVDEYGDYLELLDRKDLDAVVITTPDHWHALMTIHACQAGKDVYCEKPLSLTIAEGRRMVQAARENNRVVQTGSQQRSSKEFWTACTLVRNGVIGKVETVLAGINKPNHPGELGPDTEPPAVLDYDRWLGPAPWRNYNEKRVHYNFRFWWDYSGGQMTNFGAHHLDIAQWGLGTDDTGPIATEGTATFHTKGYHEVTETCRITHTYANGVKLIAGQGQKDIPGGTTFIGTKGRIYVNRGKLRVEPEELLEQDVAALPEQLIRSTNHTANFLECMRTREKPICDVEIGHRSATVCHLGNIVARLGRSIKWDPQTEQIVGDAEAQEMTDKAYRKPWSRTQPFATAKS